uniref:F-box domain-containing protein n=1 Tax=Caenorhabditis tropicalis TaxID=1561998 RepID=A0A1I7U1C1_9PELO
MFPLLRLPYLCIQDITNMWELIDLYNFSILSKRAKRISRRKKENDSTVKLEFDYYSISLYRNSRVVLELPTKQFLSDRSQFPLFDPRMCVLLQTTKHLLDVFNCSLDMRDWRLKPPMTKDQLIMMIDWLNGMENEVKKIVIKSATWEMLELFMNRFQRSIRKLYIRNKLGHNDYKSLNFQVKQLFLSNSSKWFHLDFLFSLDCDRIEMYNSILTEEDLNMFLRSWQEGKTNRNLKSFEFQTCSDLDIKKIVKDCGAKLKDPRTTKHEFPHIKCLKDRGNWICGGIHIRGNDGRLAILNGYFDYVEDKDVPEDLIEYYLECLELWNSGIKTWERKCSHFNFF